MADIDRGLLKFMPDGKVAVVLKEAGHWLTMDTGGTFAGIDFQKSKHWPHWFKHRNRPARNSRLSPMAAPTRFPPRRQS